MQPSLTAICVFLSFLFAVYGDTCSWTSPAGNHYDLSGLSSSTDYFLPKKSQPGLNWDVWINICRPVFTQVCGSGAAGCQQWSATGNAAMGLANTLSFAPGNETGGRFGVKLEYVGGLESRQMEIQFICLEGQVGTPVFSNEAPTHKYNFIWSSKYGCPVPPSGKGGLSGGAIFLILFICVVFVYLVGGIAFNAGIRKQRGVEMIPNLEFWVTVPGLVKDGCMWTFNKIFRRGGYSQVK